MRTLEDGHEHRVHDAEDANHDGEQRSAPAHGARDAESLTGSHHLAGAGGAALGEDFFDLCDEIGHLLGRGILCHTNVHKVDLPLLSHDVLENGERQHDGAVLDDRMAVHDAHDGQFLCLDLNLVTDLFLEHFGSKPAEHDGRLSAVLGQAALDHSELLPGEAAPFPAGDHHHRHLLNAEHPHHHRGGFSHVRQHGDLVLQRGVIHLGHDAAAHVAHDKVDAHDVELVLDALLISLGHADERHHGGDADGDADQREPSADGTPDETAYNNGEKSHLR